MRLSIELTPEQHQRLKVIAALRGQSIKDYVLEHVLPATPTAEESKALRQLEAFLAPRLQAAEEGPVIRKSVTEIFEEAHHTTLKVKVINESIKALQGHPHSPAS